MFSRYLKLSARAALPADATQIIDAGAELRKAKRKREGRLCHLTARACVMAACR